MTDNTIPIDLPKSDDSRAVSPVIGVILMVAITIILAAVIGAFVLGFSTDTETPPNTAWDSSQDPTAVSNVDEELDVTFSLDTTDRSIDATNLDVTFPDSGIDRIEDVSDDVSSDPLQAGDSLTITIEDDDLDEDDDFSDLEGDRVRVIWVGDDTSSTLTTHTLN